MANILDPVTNLAEATVSTGYDASATSIVLSSGGGAKFPQPSSAGAFNLVWFNATDYNNPADDPNVEIVRVTARSTDTLTVTRGQEGITATTKNTGGKTYKMILSFTKDSRDKIENSININTMTAKTSLVDVDELKISDSEASNVLKKITWANIKATLLTYFQGVTSSLLRNHDGWQDANETWTYASASTFTTTGNVTTKYPKGTKLKYTQTTTKYAVVNSSSYSAGTGLTTITIYVNTDYTIANASISSNYLSYAENPQGFPHHFNYSAINTGLSLGNGTMTAFYTAQGRNIKGRIDIVFGSTSSFSGTFNFNIPAEAIALVGIASLSQIGTGAAYDSSGPTVWCGAPRFIDSTHIGLGIYGGGSSNVGTTGAGSTNPFTWATSDEIHIDFEYESV